MYEQIGQAGTMESGDILVSVKKNAYGQGISVTLTSIVLAQYGPMIKDTLTTLAQQLGQTDLVITAADKGALTCTIEARLKTALWRAGLISEQEAVM